ncbi:MAG TPA: ATP-binding protein [Caulobacteraceae bacterium]
MTARGKTSSARLPLFALMFGFGLACVLAVVVVNAAVIFALPRPEPEIYQLRDIEQLLNGRPVPPIASKLLAVKLDARPPQGPPPVPQGFRIRTEQRIARDLGVKETDVVFSRRPLGAPLEFEPFSGGLGRREFRRREPSRLFELAQGSGQPVLIGPFRVGLKELDGRWRIVETRSPRLLDPWRQHVLLWFLASILATAPLAFLFARRVSAPIAAFAEGAERLGRDPNAPPLALQGSAEIAVAGRAFNDMQERLRRYVDDRTSMIGAVAHDLRTPLTRLRFHAESAPDELRRKMADDIGEMDAMVAATLAFVRDATQAGPRARLELRSLLDTVLEGFVELGRDVRLQPGESVVIEGDNSALKRMFANLIDNAVKFGGLARVVLRVEDGCAVVEVEDDGPGLPESELEAVFEPFRRVEASRNRDTGGIGLGLTAARSIARSHGGDITLINRLGGGLKVQVSLPL